MEAGTIMSRYAASYFIVECITLMGDNHYFWDNLYFPGLSILGVFIYVNLLDRPELQGKRLSGVAALELYGILA
jgi:hypothetical protein